MEVVQRGPEDDRRRAPEKRRDGRDPAVRAVLAGEEVEEGRGRREGERLNDEDARAPIPSVPSGASRAIPGSTWSPSSVRRLIVLNGSWRCPSSQTYWEKIPWSKSDANDSYRSSASVPTTSA